MPLCAHYCLANKKRKEKGKKGGKGGKKETGQIKPPRKTICLILLSYFPSARGLGVSQMGRDGADFDLICVRYWGSNFKARINTTVQ